MFCRFVYSPVGDLILLIMLALPAFFGSLLFTRSIMRVPFEGSESARVRSSKLLLVVLFLVVVFTAVFSLDSWLYHICF